jgi:hypothetical protein
MDERRCGKKRWSKDAFMIVVCDAIVRYSTNEA